MPNARSEWIEKLQSLNVKLKNTLILPEQGEDLDCCANNQTFTIVQDVKQSAKAQIFRENGLQPADVGTKKTKVYNSSAQ